MIVLLLLLGVAAACAAEAWIVMLLFGVIHARVRCPVGLAGAHRRLTEAVLMQDGCTTIAIVLLLACAAVAVGLALLNAFVAIP
jgi:hypothetical protein